MFFRDTHDEFDDFFFYKDFHTDIIVSEFFVFSLIIDDGVEIFVDLVHDLYILFHVSDRIASFFGSFGGDALGDFDLQISEFVCLLSSMFFV